MNECRSVALIIILWDAGVDSPEEHHRAPLDLLQEAYLANRSVDNAFNMGLAPHAPSPRLPPGYNQGFCFLDHHHPGVNWTQTLSALSVSFHLLVDHYLPDRQDAAGEAGKIPSSTRTIRTGPLQGFAFSPLLCSLYSHNCRSEDPTFKLLKKTKHRSSASSETASESVYGQEVELLILLCGQKNLNKLKTMAMTFYFRKSPPIAPHHTQQHHRCFGSTISQDQKWASNIDTIGQKAQQRLHFLRQLRKDH